jgi:hypothetical protein
VAHSLAVHQGLPDLRPETPTLLLLGDTGDPLCPLFDAFVAWCAAHWQVVFLRPGRAEAVSPLHTAQACRKHANVTLLEDGARDTTLEGVVIAAVEGGVTLTTAAEVIRLDTEGECPAVTRVYVTPADPPCAIDAGWARLGAVVAAPHSPDSEAPPGDTEPQALDSGTPAGAREPPGDSIEPPGELEPAWVAEPPGDSQEPPCRMCGYATHRERACPLAWAPKHAAPSKAAWRSTRRCASAPAVTAS